MRRQRAKQISAINKIRSHWRGAKVREEYALLLAERRMAGHFQFFTEQRNKLLVTNKAVIWG
jgi:hypothetical protein